MGSRGARQSHPCSERFAAAVARSARNRPATNRAEHVPGAASVALFPYLWGNRLGCSLHARGTVFLYHAERQEVALLCEAGPAVGVPPWPFTTSLGPARSVGRLPLDGSRWRVEGPTKWGEGLRQTLQQTLRKMSAAGTSRIRPHSSGGAFGSRLPPRSGFVCACERTSSEGCKSPPGKRSPARNQT